MISIKKMVLGAAVAIGGLAAAATPANAAVRVFVGAPIAPVAYVPACPGPGYVWTAGYYAGGVWVPGFWRFGGVRGPVVVDRFHGPVYGRGFYGHERFRR
jgi:hypothetical protein